MVMTRDALRELVVGSLRKVAPDAATADLRDDVDLREQFELDSMDFLTFVERLHDGTGVDIPERDYPKLATLAGCLDYLAAHAPAGAAG